MKKEKFKVAVLGKEISNDIIGMNSLLLERATGEKSRGLAGAKPTLAKSSQDHLARKGVEVVDT